MKTGARQAARCLCKSWKGLRGGRVVLYFRPMQNGFFSFLGKISRAIFPGTLLFLALLAGWVQAQEAAPEILWQRCIGGSAYDDAYAMELLPDSSFIIVAGTYSYDVPELEKTTGDADVLLFKINLVGDVLWRRAYGGSLTEQPADVKYLPDGGLVVCGYSDSPEYSEGERDLFVLRVDALGRLRWARGYGGQGNDRGSALLPTPDGGFLIAGETGSNQRDVKENHGGLDGWLVKLDAQGKLQWERSIGGSQNDKLKVLIATQDGNYLAAGPSDSKDGHLKGNNGRTDVMIVKIQPDGNILWVKNVGGDSFDDVFGLSQLPDGDLLMVGTTYSSSGQIHRSQGENDIYLARLDADAQLKWMKAYGGSQDDGGNSLQVAKDGSLLVAATSRSNDGLLPDCYGKYDGWLMCTDADGVVRWSQNYGGSKSEQLYAAHALADGSYLAIGSSSSTDFDLNYATTYGGNDVWVANMGFRPRPRATLPTTLVGYVRDANSQAVIPAEVSLIHNETNRVVASVQSDTTIGTYFMSFADSADLSLGVQVPGYMFYSAAVVLAPRQLHTENRFDILLKPIARGEKLNLSNIHFDAGQAVLRKDSYAELDRIYRFLKLNPSVRVRIAGHTDDTGDPSTKQILSLTRAKVVIEYLVNRGLLYAQMEPAGYGMSRPLVPNTSPENRQKNRRVEIEVLDYK